MEKKYKKGIQLRYTYGAYNQTKQNFQVPICFCFQCLSQGNLLLESLFENFWKFVVLYLGSGGMTIDFTTEMTLNHLLPSIPINKKLECKIHQMYSKSLRKICKKEV